MHQVRKAAVAGTFYHAQQQQLSSDVRKLLATARSETKRPPIHPKALIVPHAGYIYSGSVAASAYAQLTNDGYLIKRVVLLGPVHRVPVHGLALPGCDAFATPLGEVPIDLDAAAIVSQLPQVVTSPFVHTDEHSLEVQLPFLQTVLNKFKLLPLAVGNATPSEVAEVLESVWGGEETLIVISSDLSHFLAYDEARSIDGDTVKNILSLHGGISHEQACGGTPVNGFIQVANNHQLQAQLLDLRNSGDTAGDKSRVVGYTAIAFTESQTNNPVTPGSGAEQ